MPLNGLPSWMTWLGSSAQALANLGWSGTFGVDLDEDSLVARSGVTAGCQRLFAASSSIAAELGVLAPSGTGWRVLARCCTQPGPGV